MNKADIEFIKNAFKHGSVKEVGVHTRETSVQGESPRHSPQQANHETQRCRDCGKFDKCGKTGFLEMSNCSGWEPRRAS